MPLSVRWWCETKICRFHGLLIHGVYPWFCWQPRAFNSFDPPRPFLPGQLSFSDLPAFLNFSRGFLLIHRAGWPCVVRASGILLQAVASGSWLVATPARGPCSPPFPLAKSVCTNVRYMSTIYCTNVLRWVIKKTRRNSRRDTGRPPSRRRSEDGGESGGLNPHT